MAYIYKIENQINHKVYIGKTEYEPERRWKEHQRESKKERNSHRAIYRAINKYGIENFSFEVLEETFNPNEREQFYIINYDSYHNGYNETLGGDGAAYLELPEQEICKYYIKNRNLKQTYTYFGYDKKTILKVLYKYNIPIIPTGEVTREKTKKSVARLDKNTGEILEIFAAVEDAHRAYPNTHRHIGSVCQGKRKTAGGFGWKYIDVEEEMEWK